MKVGNFKTYFLFHSSMFFLWWLLMGTTSIYTNLFKLVEDCQTWVLFWLQYREYFNNLFALAVYHSSFCICWWQAILVWWINWEMITLFFFWWWWLFLLLLLSNLYFFYIILSIVITLYVMHCTSLPYIGTYGNVVNWRIKVKVLLI